MCGRWYCQQRTGMQIKVKLNSQGGEGIQKYHDTNNVNYKHYIRCKGHKIGLSLNFAIFCELDGIMTASDGHDNIIIAMDLHSLERTISGNS